MAVGDLFFEGLRRVLRPVSGPAPAAGPLRPAGVLVPLRARPAAPGDGAGAVDVVLARRSERVPHHKGQVCFPGGSRDPGDPDLLATALREAEEELGIRREDLDLLGTMDPVPTVTGFIIQPFVARLAEGATFRLDGFEMEEVFEVPLDVFGDEDRYRYAEATFLGRPDRVDFIDVGHRTVWGATAKILRRLAALSADARRRFDTVPGPRLT